MPCSARLALLFTPCLLLACEGRSASDSDETGDTGEDGCMPADAVQFTVVDDSSLTDDGVVTGTCEVMAADQDPDDPRRWTLALECLSSVQIELVMDPPPAELPFAVGDVLQAAISDGAEFQLVELEDAEGPLMALLFSSGPAGGMVDQPLFFDGQFEFEWSPADDCSTTDSSCGEVSQLQIDANAGGETLGLGPALRYGELTGSAGESYGLWIGDSWAGDCGGQASEAFRYAVVALP